MEQKCKPKEKHTPDALRERPSILAGLLVGAALLLGLFFTRGLEGMELKFYDLRINASARSHSATHDIVIVAVDDESLQRMEPAVGRWPWPRAVFAGLIDYMSEAQTISFDVIFPEADWQFAESDDLFVESVLQHGRVILGAFMEEAVRHRLEPVKEAKVPIAGAFRQDSSKLLVPYPSLRAATYALGHVNIFPDRDGVVRQYPMRSVLRGVAYPSLGNQIRRGTRSGFMKAADEDEYGFILLQPYHDTPPVLSAVDVLSAWNEESSGKVPSIDRSVFRGKHVLVGSLATGLQQDRRVTPWGVNVPGVYIAATAVNNMLDGIQVRRAPWMVNLALLLLLSGLCISFSSATPVRQGVGTIFLLLIFLSLNLLVFILGAVWVDAVLPSLAVVFFSVYLGMIRWYQEMRRRRELEALEIAKQDLTDMLVHDLKGRSGTILMGATMVQEYLGDTDDSIKVLISSMLASSQRLEAETSGLLDIRKMTEGKLAVRKEAFSVHSLLVLLKDQNDSTAQIAGSNLSLTCDENLVVNADQDLLGRIISNLIWNAVQHVKKGTDIMVVAYVEKGAVIIDVHNQGPIIPPERMSELFIPFLSGGTVTVQPGQRRSGLGLTFCKLAMEAHGGHIEVISPSPEYSGGACFRLIIPQ